MFKKSGQKRRQSTPSLRKAEQTPSSKRTTKKQRNQAKNQRKKQTRKHSTPHRIKNGENGNFGNLNRETCK